MGRKILGVIVGWITAVAIIMIVEMIGSVFNPQPPRNFLKLSPEETAEYVKTIPIGAYLTVAFGYLLGAFAGGWMVTKISKQRDSSLLPLLVGILLTLGAVYNFFYMLPGQPVWFIVLCLLIFIPFALLGHRTAR